MAANSEKPGKGTESPPVYIPVESIEQLLAQGLITIQHILNKCMTDATGPRGASRDCVQNLNDCMRMLNELKKQERDLLESATDEDLKAIVEADSVVKAAD